MANKLRKRCERENGEETRRLFFDKHAERMLIYTTQCRSEFVTDSIAPQFLTVHTEGHVASGLS